MRTRSRSGWRPPPACIGTPCKKRSISSGPRTAITEAEAVKLIWAYLSFDAYRNFAPIGRLRSMPRTIAGATRSTPISSIKTADGASIAAMMVRPNSATSSRSPRCSSSRSMTRRTTPWSARPTAMWGSWPTPAQSRAGSRRVVPYQHDGEDARAVINWIAKQPWSDGRVGMYGDGYSGFTPLGRPQQSRRPRSRPSPPRRPSRPASTFPMEGEHLSELRLPLVFAGHQHQGVARRELQATTPFGARSMRSGTGAAGRYRDLGRLYGQAQSDLHSLAESPEL